MNEGAEKPKVESVSVTAQTLVTHTIAKVSEAPAPNSTAPDSSGLVPTHAGPICASCHQANHPNTFRCVFCGTVFTNTLPPQNEAADGPASARGPISVRSSPSTRPPRFEPGDAPPLPSTNFGATLTSLTASTASSAALRKSSISFDDIHLPVADPLIGVVVADRYRITEGLGRGGMGIVYKVEHKQIGKLLAMKLLTGELSRNPEVVRRFKHEALTSSRLSSPNTVQVFDFGVSDGLTYLVMELVAGEDLSRILRAQGPMPWSRLGRVIIQICSSLAEAHTKGIVHRDIKPENIMLVRGRDGSDIAKVLDFGLAKLREGEGLSELTSAGAIVGTPYFMSPEQVRGDPVDARSDIYSLGALMYRALTGHYPFNGPTPMSVFTKHLTEVAVPPVDRTPELNIPLSVSRIVMKALLKNPAERFQRVEDLQTAVVEQLRALGTSSVETLLDSGAVRKLETANTQARGPTGAVAEIATRDEVERYERKLRRQRYGAYAFLAVLLLGTGGAFAKFAQSRKPIFMGVEREPNDIAGDASEVPFGRTVTGYLGKRIDPTHGDRDFFAIDIPPASAGSLTALVSLKVTALPNIPMCTMLYRPGLTTALGQYCVGRSGRDLEIPALRLEAGRYFVAVVQDMDSYGTQTPRLVYENISDTYAMTIEKTERETGVETEPNDQVASATSIGLTDSVAGVLGWARDEDVFCVRAAVGEYVTFIVTDAPRESGTVLEVTPLRGTETGAAVRVHSAGKEKASGGDVISPWQSPAVQVEPDVPRCIRTRLALDPWTPARSATVPSGGTEEYTVAARLTE